MVVLCVMIRYIADKVGTESHASSAINTDCSCVDIRIVFKRTHIEQMTLQNYTYDTTMTDETNIHYATFIIMHIVRVY